MTQAEADPVRKCYGFTLEEIKEMILLFVKKQLKFSGRRKGEVDENIKELQVMQEEMVQLLREFTEKLEF